MLLVGALGGIPCWERLVVFIKTFKCPYPRFGQRIIYTHIDHIICDRKHENELNIQLEIIPSLILFFTVVTHHASLPNP